MGRSIDRSTGPLVQKEHSIGMPTIDCMLGRRSPSRLLVQVPHLGCPLIVMTAASGRTDGAPFSGGIPASLDKPNCTSAYVVYILGALAFGLETLHNLSILLTLVTRGGYGKGQLASTGRQLDRDKASLAIGRPANNSLARFCRRTIEQLQLVWCTLHVVCALAC